MTKFNNNNSTKKSYDWPGLDEDSYVWDSLRRYGNTCIGYDNGIALLKHVWHMKYSKHTPSNFMTDPFYSVQYNDCINELEKYLSEISGKNIKISLTENSFKNDYGGFHRYKSWFIECKK